MLGPFLVTLFLTLLGIVAHILRLGVRKTRKAAHDLGLDEKVEKVTQLRYLRYVEILSYSSILMSPRDISRISRPR